MKILPIQNNVQNKKSFKAATVCINSFSDTHGELELANNALESLRNRQQDLFCRSEKGSANVLAVSGDWFMDSGRKGFSFSPDETIGDIQMKIYNEFVHQVKDFAPDLNTLFTPGNHEFDGGVELLNKLLTSLDSDILATNLKKDESFAFKNICKNNKVINQKIIEVEDDKNPDLKHKLLFLGIMPVNLSYYQKKLNGVSLINNVFKNQKSVEKEDYKETLEDCKKRINDFKNENPKGVVVIMSHTGVDFADNLVKEAPVNLVFDGHEHKDAIRVVNGTPIVPLSLNFKKIVNARINFDDNGDIPGGIGIKSFSPLDNKTKGPLLQMYNKLLGSDIKKEYSVKTPVKELTSLDTTDIRKGNNYLANFVTDSVLEELKKTNPDVDIFALNSSAIRHPLSLSDEPSISKFDVMNVLAGIREDDGKIMTTEVSGRTLLYMILDNFTFNKDFPEKNPLIHYSGLNIDRTNLMESFKNGDNGEKLAEFVIDTKTNKPVELDSVYKIANVEKYFNKSNNDVIRDMKNISDPTPYTVQQLFKQHFTSSNGNLYAKCDERIK